MLSRLRDAKLIWPAIATIVGLLVLVMLGAWQWQRMQWKEGLISAIEVRRAAEPVPMSALATCRPDPAKCEYMRVRLTGRYDHANERHVYASRNGAPGWHIFTPLVTDTGGPQTYWVNRGFVPDARKAPSSRADRSSDETIDIIGVFRKARAPGYFVPEPDPTANIWYAPNVVAMSASLAALATEQTATPADAFYFDAERAGNQWPQGSTTNYALSNRHLSYALTWWGLAATLLGVFAAFAWQRLYPSA